MSREGRIATVEDRYKSDLSPYDGRSGFDSKTGIYHSLNQFGEHQKIPDRADLDTATFVLSQLPHPKEAESRVALIDSATNRRVTYVQLRHSINSLATGLYHALGVRKGDVVLVVSPNSLLYPTICLAVLSLGAILTTANPLNTESELAKQICDSGAKLGIASPEVVHKLIPSGVRILLTSRPSHDDDKLSVEELIHGCDPMELPNPRIDQLDTAVILYSSGTTGTSKGVLLTHANFISILKIVQWSVDVSSSQNDVFLCFTPMFHIYGLAFFGLGGLFCFGVTTVLMPRFDLRFVLEAIQNHQVNNVPAVPPVILGLLKANTDNYDLSSLRRVLSGAAPLSKEVAAGFREKFPFVELRQGYGLTECGGVTFFVSEKEARARLGSSGRLLPSISAKVVDIESGLAMPPGAVGELWLKGQVVMKGYLGNEEATAATIDPDGWLRTGDLCYFDQDGFVYIVDRIKELIKYNGYQVAPAELEAILLSHPQILDSAVIPVEDEETGQIPKAYVVRATGSELTEDQIIQFVASQVAPYKKVRRVSFISAIPRSAAGKILRKALVSLSQH
ncbi:hypothetical protein RHSIM_Rhsim09G0145700 [Rhododendron simsii]|uniref:4-coumarate--CoA ligase n=1 Tax=Rhododendron simsii TaxID=118357 RepID=A0A834GDN0_RHOSS|nr:hypothetical protein RHSIM_Rhsim09G0145700 [Rhododendron simsii]